MAKKFSVKSKSNIFKSLGLLALIIFTFYFIYNYLATGSFSLKPRASEVVVNDVNSCSQLLTDVDCNRLSTRGCSWVVGPSTTKTENVPQTTTVPVTNKLQVDCTDSDCSSGRHGCSYTTSSKTVNQTQVQAVYECDDGSGVSQSKCIQLGGAWVKTGTRTVTVPVTTTTKTCDESWENTVTIQQSVTTYTTKVVQVPGVGSCTGTLKPLTVQATPIPPIGGGGGGSSGGGVSSTPSTSSGTCSAGMTRCEGKLLKICTGNNTEQSTTCSNGCGIINGVAKCKTSTVLGCKVGEIISKACTKPGYFKKGECKSFAGIGIWRYGQCNDLKSIPKLTERGDCKIDKDNNTYYDKFNKESYPMPDNGNFGNCVPLTLTKLGCGIDPLSEKQTYRMCLSADVSGYCSNIGKYEPCTIFWDNSDTAFYDSNNSVKNLICRQKSDCINATKNVDYFCNLDPSSGQAFYARCFDGHCAQKSRSAECSNPLNI